MCRRLLLLLLVACSTAWAYDDTLSVDMRYRSLSVLDNTVAPTLLYDRPVFSWLTTELGTRLSFSSSAVEALDYKADLYVPVVSFLTLGFRLLQSNRVSDGTAATTILAHADSTVWFFSFLGMSAALGYYDRLTALVHAVPLPFVSGTSFSDQDFALSVGFVGRPARGWLAEFKLATFEEIDVYNLNSPYFQAGASYSPAGKSWSAFGFARYRVLLGFGRRDETAVGVGLRFNLNAPAGARS